MSRLQNRIFRPAAAVIAALAMPLWAQTVFIDDATVHTMVQPEPMESADILIVDGVITAVDYGLEIPPDAQVIEAEGRPVTPGLFAGISGIGLEEVGLEASTVDDRLMFEETPVPDKLRPEFDVALAFNPDSTVVPVTRIEGYSWTVLGAQRAGSIIGGQGRPALLSGSYDSTIGEPVLFIDVGADAVDQSGGSRAAQWMLLNQAMDEAGSALEWTPDPVLTPAGRKALKLFSGRAATAVTVFHVHRASDILQALAFSAEHELNPVISGASEAWKVADRLAQAGVPVLLDPLINLPYDFDQIGARLDAAALLHEAGVTVGFINAGDATHNARALRYGAGVAVANGLPWHAALAALTINPARTFGVDRYTGTIEEHQRANLVIWSGDPLEATAVADQVIMGGRLDPMVSRQTLLRDRYFSPQDSTGASTGGELPPAYDKP